MEIIRGTANCYLVFWIVMVVMMMTRRLMMKLLLVLRSWVTSLGYCGLVEATACGWMVMMMMVMIFSVSGLLDVITLMRIHRVYSSSVLLLIRIRRGRRVIQIGVTQTVLRRNYRRGGSIFVKNGARRRVEALRRRTRRCARVGG